jgi:ADP-ribosylglycohydrolase
MHPNAQAMVLASFVGDSHALGVHWIYDTDRIEREYGRVDEILGPPSDSFHTTKTAGEFSHYGDQTLVLLESLAARGGFHLDDFWQRWKDLFASYDGYVDQATKGTLRNIQGGKGPEEAGSFSDELAGAARIAPLVYWYPDDVDALSEAVQAQTRMTHNNPVVLQSGLFFARIAQDVLAGASPVAAMERSVGGFPDSPISQWVKEGLESKDTDSLQAVRRFGQTCHSEQAFPDVIHFIARYESDLEEALVRSAMAGGDSAGRGLLIGMILGAHLGKAAIPERWIAAMRKTERIQELLEKKLES